jgi:deoxyribose-phosphate aldolase
MTHKQKLPTDSAQISGFALAQKIDHTLLKPIFNTNDLRILCEEAALFQFKTVCIPPSAVSESVSFLSGTKVDVITVVGFPLGYSTSQSKAREASEAIASGAREIDMVINLSYLKSNRLHDFEDDIKTVVRACAGVPLKVIIETAYLDEAEKLTAAKLAESAGAQFVKTSTGFATGMPITGATVADIKLLRQNLKPTTLIKASGGIKSLAGALELIAAGADRLGTSSGVALMKGLEIGEGY